MANAGNPQMAQTPQIGQQAQNPQGIGANQQPQPFIPQSLPQFKQQQPRGPQPNTPDLYTGPDYSKEQMGMGGAVPKGYYSGPTDGVHKYGEGPLAVQTQQFLDNNPDYLTGGTQAPQQPQFPSHWEEDRSFYAKKAEIDEARRQRQQDPVAMAELERINSTFKAPQIDSSLPMKPPQGQGMGGTISDMLTNMQDQRMTPPQGQNIFEQSAGAYRGALDAAGQPTATGSIANTDLSQYTNPYEAQVVQNTMDDLERTRLMQQNQMSASASSAGAFGGSRQGIAEAETNLGFARQAANTAAQLRQAGYNQALTSAGQDVGYGLQQGQQRLQQGQQLGSLANLGLGMGQSVQNQQTQQGLQQQIMNQALIDAAGQQYQGYINSPQMAQTAFGDYLANSNLRQSNTTDTKQAGLLQYLSMAADLGLF
tara:strand:+ start:957 stop:2228 length:1272 start_codon:yes stop_codon:yes gene_type:complete